VIKTAGREAPAPQGSAKREAIARIRAVLRNQNAPDAQVDDALEALTELSRTED
jgi:hypothetical protein